jgi:Golgi phosphoprotein 3 (GPP34)
VSPRVGSPLPLSILGPVPGRLRWVIVVAMDELGQDLLLIAVNSDGTLVLSAKLRFGLAGSELVRLAAAGRVDIVRGRIVLRNPASTGDPLLDEALASMSSGWREPTAKAWVKRSRPGLVERYLARAEAAGTIRAHRRKALGFIPVTRWAVIDTARAAQARARLEAAAAGAGALAPAQAALAGLASAIEVTHFVFPGRAGAAARKRLREAARREPAAATATAAVDGAAAAQHAVVDAATRAATDAAVRAATDAAATTERSGAAGLGGFEQIAAGRLVVLLRQGDVLPGGEHVAEVALHGVGQR